MARTKRKPIQLATPPRARPLWFDGLSPRDLDHIAYLVETGVDKHRIPLEPSNAAQSSMTTTQIDSGQVNVPATPQNTIISNELPDEQEETHQESSLNEGHEVLTFDFGNAPSANEDAPNPESASLRCRRCSSTFVFQHELVSHVWGAHLKQENQDWLPRPVHQEQEVVMQELIGVLAEYENLAGVSPPVIASGPQPYPVEGPPIAVRKAYTHRPASSVRPQSSMMSVFAVDNRSATSGLSRNNAPRVLAPAQPVQLALPQPRLPPPMSVTAAPGSAFPRGALEPDQPFKLGQPAPLGIKLPTNNSMTAFKWEAYKRRGLSAFDWTDKKSIKLANRWRSRVSQAAFKRLGIRLDRRKKSAAVVDDDEGEENEENEGSEDEDEKQEEQDGEQMDTREE